MKRIGRIIQKHTEKEILNLRDGKRLESQEAVAAVQRLEAVKRKIENLLEEEEKYCRKLLSRMQNATAANADTEELMELRINRLVADYFLRREYWTSVDAMCADSAGTNSMALKVVNLLKKDMVDPEFYRLTNKVKQTLKNKSCKECLIWCAENKNSLKKMQSQLEFKLRIQEFVELLKARRLEEAIAYSQKYFGLFVEEYFDEVKRVMALLAIPLDTSIACYKVASSLNSRHIWMKVDGMI